MKYIGMDKLTNNLRASAVLLKKQQAIISSKAGTLCTKRAKRNCPYLTGNLQGSIKWRKFASGFGVVVGAYADYASYVEYGTIAQRPRPYLIPAYNETLPDYIQACKDLTREIKKVMTT